MVMRPYTYLDFASEPTPIMMGIDGTIPALADNDVTLYKFSTATLEGKNTGAITTDLPIFNRVAQGHTIPLYSADAIGGEFGFGPLTSSHMEYTIGTSPAFFCRLRFDIPDVSEYDVAAVGFRIQGAQADITTAATLNAYTDIACLNVNAGDIAINTELNNGGLTTTDTTDDWADGEENTLAVYVSAAGVVTYKLTTAGGAESTLAAPTATAAFTFDDGDVVQPFIAFVATADTNASAAILVNFECGYQ